MSRFLTFLLSLLTLSPCILAQDSIGTLSYDYVIVGGGTCGLVIANRLSEDSNVTVAIIEAGGSVFDNPNVTTTLGYGPAFFTDIDYAYNTTQQIYTSDRIQTYHSGKALGGTSTINGKCDQSIPRLCRQKVDLFDSFV